jgi:dihydrofolate reductase
MILTMIAAVAENGVIGRADGGLPWHLPAEAASFRHCCEGQWLLMGHRTYQEMTGWFQPGHRVLVLTRQPSGSRRQDTAAAAVSRAEAPVAYVASVAEAITQAESGGASELVVLGGGQTYAAALPYATQLRLSRIPLNAEGSVTFPRIPEAFHLAATEPHDGWTVEWWQRGGVIPELTPLSDALPRRLPAR